MTVTCGRFGNSATTARPLPTRSPSQLRGYFLFLENEKKFAYGSLRVAYSGIKFFFTRTCKRDWQTLAQMKLRNIIIQRSVMA
jgi:hypothetical protein